MAVASSTRPPAHRARRPLLRRHRFDLSHALFLAHLGQSQPTTVVSRLLSTSCTTRDLTRHVTRSERRRLDCRSRRADLDQTLSFRKANQHSSSRRRNSPSTTHLHDCTTRNQHSLSSPALDWNTPPARTFAASSPWTYLAYDATALLLDFHTLLCFATDRPASPFNVLSLPSPSRTPDLASRSFLLKASLYIYRISEPVPSKQAPSPASSPLISSPASCPLLPQARFLSF